MYSNSNTFNTPVTSPEAKPLDPKTTAQSRKELDSKVKRDFWLAIIESLLTFFTFNVICFFVSIYMVTQSCFLSGYLKASTSLHEVVMLYSQYNQDRRKASIAYVIASVLAIISYAIIARGLYMNYFDEAHFDLSEILTALLIACLGPLLQSVHGLYILCRDRESFDDIILSFDAALEGETMHQERDYAERRNHNLREGLIV